MAFNPDDVVKRIIGTQKYVVIDDLNGHCRVTFYPKTNQGVILTFKDADLELVS